MPGVACCAYSAWTLWCLGYPAQALQRAQEALALAQALAHPYSLAQAHYWVTFRHQRRRDVAAVQAHAETLLRLATAQEYPLLIGLGICLQGWALAMQGQDATCLVPMYQGLTTVLATGQTLSQPLCLLLLAEAADCVGQVEEGLRLLDEALAAFAASGRGDLLGEAYRLQGSFLLQQAVPDVTRAEACFQQALTIAHSPAGQSLGAACRHESGPLVATARQAPGGFPSPCPSVRQAYGGL
jgi:tetratricopeptide (TPR) repeat protein